jgi:phage/plasmid primase-like uncharacterized protein
MLDCRRTRRRRTGEEHRGPASCYAVDCCNSLLRRSSVDKDKQRMQSQGLRRRTSGGKCFVCGEEEEEEEEEEAAAAAEEEEFRISRRRRRKQALL